jgi:hypothetical protein
MNENHRDIRADRYVAFEVLPVGSYFVNAKLPTIALLNFCPQNRAYAY